MNKNKNARLKFASKEAFNKAPLTQCAGGCGGWLFKEAFQREHKNDKFYCKKCIMKIKEAPNESANQDFDSLLDACLNTPPLRYKDLQAQLKREREKKLRLKQKKA